MHSVYSTRCKYTRTRVLYTIIKNVNLCNAFHNKLQYHHDNDALFKSNRFIETKNETFCKLKTNRMVVTLRGLFGRLF